MKRLQQRQQASEKIAILHSQFWPQLQNVFQSHYINVYQNVSALEQASNLLK